MEGKRIGRPRTKTPKNNIVGCKLTDTELERLEKYCLENNFKKSTVLRNGIKNIILTDNSKGVCNEYLCNE